MSETEARHGAENDATPEQVLALPMDPNDSGADTVRGYLVALLARLWLDGEGFGGKRPFGNSGWQWDLMLPLVKAGMIDGQIDADGYLDDCDDALGNRLILAAIRSLDTRPIPPEVTAASRPADADTREP